MDLWQSADLFFIPQQSRALKKSTLRLVVWLSCVNMILWSVAITMQVCRRQQNSHFHFGHCFVILFVLLILSFSSRLDYTIDCHGLFISLHTGVYRYRLGIHHFAHVDLFDVRPQSK